MCWVTKRNQRAVSGKLNSLRPGELTHEANVNIKTPHFQLPSLFKTQLMNQEEFLQLL